MKSLSYQAKLELSKTNFSVCNLGLTSFTKETMESPRPQNVSGRTTAVSNSPTLKMKKLSIPAFEKAAARKKELSPKFKQSKSYKTTDFVQDSLDTYTFRNTKRTDFHTKTEEVESPLKPNRVSSAVSDSSPSPTPRRASSVRIVSLNQQIGMQTKSNNEEKASTAFQQKFAKKYTHFKRTQNNAFMHCLGRFKSIAEINDRVSSIHVEPTLKQTFADWEKEIAKACPTEREKAVMQKQVKQIVRLRRKILDGEIDFSKYCTDKDNRFALDKNQENFISAQPTNLLRPQNSMNVWLQGQNPEADQAIENPFAHHQKRSYVTSARESVRIRQDNGKVEPVKVLKNEMVNETHRKNTVSNVVSYRDPKNVSSKDKVRVNRTRTHSNAPTRQFVNMHTEKMKYKPQSLEVSLIADSRGPKSLIDGTTLDSPDKTVMEPETLKNALMEVKGERSIGLPVIAREMLRGISKSNGDSANNQEQRAKERSKSKEAKGSGIDDIMNLKVEGWSRNEKQKIKKSK